MQKARSVFDLLLAAILLARHAGKGIRRRSRARARNGAPVYGGVRPRPGPVAVRFAKAVIGATMAPTSLPFIPAFDLLGFAGLK